MRLWSTFKRNWITAIAIIFVVSTCGFLVIKNIKKCSFFNANLVDVLTILLGILVVFYLTEHLTDNRRRNDCIEHIIMEIEGLVSADENFSISPSSLMKQSSCANRIKYLNDAAFPDIQTDIKFISDHFSEIRDLYSNHNSSEDNLNSVRTDIDKHRTYIVDKCCKIRLGLYSVQVANHSSKDK